MKTVAFCTLGWKLVQSVWKIKMGKIKKTKIAER